MSVGHNTMEIDFLVNNLTERYNLTYQEAQKISSEWKKNPTEENLKRLISNLGRKTNIHKVKKYKRYKTDSFLNLIYNSFFFIRVIYFIHFFIWNS